MMWVSQSSLNHGHGRTRVHGSYKNVRRSAPSCKRWPTADVDREKANECGCAPSMLYYWCCIPVEAACDVSNSNMTLQIPRIHSGRAYPMQQRFWAQLGAQNR